MGVSPRKPDFIVTFSPVTPIFMGGAEPNERAEMRLASIKGLLRFWYRAVDPEYRTHEGTIFGGIGKGLGQASFLLSCPAWLTDDTAWLPDTDLRLFDRGHGPSTRNGLRYIGYSLRLGQNDRKSIRASGIPGRPAPTVRVDHHWRPGPRSERAAKALVASWWLLCTLGGLGSRCRRGLGSVSLDRWSGEDDLTSQLPLPSGAKDLAEWRQRVADGLRVILREWFPGPRSGTPSHSRFPDSPEIRVAESGGDPWNWKQALERGGRLLQDFRVRSAPDYADVKTWLLAPVPGPPLMKAPERAAFGLPLTWRYSKVRATASVLGWSATHGKALDRMASPLWLRVAKVGGGHYPLFLLLDTPFLGSDGLVLVTKTVQGASPEQHPHPGDGVLKGFMTYLGTKPDVRRVVL